MACNLDVSDIIENFHSAYCEHGMPYIAEFLITIGFDFEIWSFDKKITPGVYLAVVPSLNIQATMHHILIEFVDTEDGLTWAVHDPKMHYGSGHKYYTTDQDCADPLSVFIGGAYVIALKFLDYSE